MPEAPAPSYTGSHTTADGLTLFTQGWLPAPPARAVVLLVHGYAEHSGRYAAVAARLVAEGYAVPTYDQRGWGRSEGRRAYVAQFDDYLDDLALVLADVRHRHPGLPVFLFGQSMGGAVVALYVIERQPALAGVILASPALRSDDAPLLQKVAGVLARLAPTLPTIAFGVERISRDPAVVARVKQDPLFYHGRILARTGAELLRAMKRIEAGATQFASPVLLLHGTADAVTLPEATADFHTRIASEDNTLRLFEGLWHETYNEPEQEAVYDLLLGWLAART